MKKLFVLLLLFVVAAAIALGLVINEQRRRTVAPVQTGSQSVSSTGITTNNAGAAAVSSAPTSTNEGNISLTVTAPQDNSSTQDSSVTVAGKTSPGANIMINEYEITAGPDGSFSKTVALDDGENYLSIVAYTVNGDVAERQLTVTKNVSSY